MAANFNSITATVDVHCIDDFLANMPTVSGRTALVQRLIRRITKRKGQFPWTEKGIDIRDYLLSKRRAQDAAADVYAECIQDEQVAELVVFAELSNDGRDLSLSFEVTDAEGPFTFTLEIDNAVISLVTLLNAAA